MYVEKENWRMKKNTKWDFDAGNREKPINLINGMKPKKKNATNFAIN